MTQTTSTAIRFFVAAPQGNRDAIAGLGYTAEQAIADAYAQVGTKPAVVSQDADTQHPRQGPPRSSLERSPPHQ